MSAKRTSESNPLLGRRILVTRAAEQSAEFSAALAELGGEAVTIPTITIVPPPTYDDLDQALADLGQIDYLLLTSVNAVEAFFARLKVLSLDIGILDSVRIVAVGPKSADALVAHGVSADLIPDDYRAEGVVALLKDEVSGKRLLYPKAALARDLIPAELSLVGAEVIAPVVYASAPPADAAEDLHKALADGLDLLTFTASSTVKNFVELLDAENLVRARQTPVASIGPLTSATASKLGFDVVVEPVESTLEAMLDAIQKYFSGTGDAEREIR